MSLVELLNGLGKCSLYLWFTAFCIYVFITGSFIHYFCIRNWIKTCTFLSRKIFQFTLCGSIQRNLHFLTLAFENFLRLCAWNACRSNDGGRGSMSLWGMLTMQKSKGAPPKQEMKRRGLFLAAVAWEHLRPWVLLWAWCDFASGWCSWRRESVIVWTPWARRLHLGFNQDCHSRFSWQHCYWTPQGSPIYSVSVH